MSKFEVTREMAYSIGWNTGNPGKDGDCETFEQNRMILSALLDIRDLLAPTVVTQEEFDPKKYPNDLGPCEVEFCTEKAALIDFEDQSLGKLFVPFSRMAPGIASACVEGAGFDEFRLGNWMFERLKEQAKEDRGNQSSHDNPGFDGLGVGEDRIPF